MNLPREVAAGIQRGWCYMPCAPQGKTALLKGWPTLATANPETIERWGTRYPGCNWGVATGPISGVFALDVDGEVARASLAALETHYGPLPITLTIVTGREDGGEHLWFRYPVGRTIRNSAGKLGAGLDVRAAGGYVVVPPSIHPSGKKYIFNDETVPISNAPEWLLELAARSDTPTPRALASEIGILPKGQRNDGLTRFAGALRRRGATLEELEAELLQVNVRRCRPALPENDVRKIAESICRYEPGGPDPLEFAWKAVLTQTQLQGYRQFLALAQNLQTARPGLAVALPLERIGTLIGCDWTQVRRWRQRAVREGYLRPKERYVPHRRAALYAFTECPTRGTKENVPLGKSVPLIYPTNGLVVHPSFSPSGTAPAEEVRIPKIPTAKINNSEIPVNTSDLEKSEAENHESEVWI